MKAATLDWIEKAEADYLAAVDLARRRKVPLHDMVCFHCQQSAEKYFKGRLEEAAKSFPKLMTWKACWRFYSAWSRYGRRLSRPQSGLRPLEF